MKRDKNSKLVNKNITKPVRIDAGWHREFKTLAIQQGKTIRELVEYGFPETLETFKEESD